MKTSVTWVGDTATVGEWNQQNVLMCVMYAGRTTRGRHRARVEFAIRSARGEHTGLDALDDGMEAFDLLLGAEIVVLCLGGVRVKFFVGHGDA